MYKLKHIVQCTYSLIHCKSYLQSSTYKIVFNSNASCNGCTIWNLVLIFEKSKCQLIHKETNINPSNWMESALLSEFFFAGFLSWNYSSILKTWFGSNHFFQVTIIVYWSFRPHPVSWATETSGVTSGEYSLDFNHVAISLENIDGGAPWFSWPMVSLTW